MRTHCTVTHESLRKAKVYIEVWKVHTLFWDFVNPFRLNPISKQNIQFSKPILYFHFLAEWLRMHSICWPTWNFWIWGIDISLQCIVTNLGVKLIQTNIDPIDSFSMPNRFNLFFVTWKDISVKKSRLWLILFCFFRGIIY